MPTARMRLRSLKSWWNRASKFMKLPGIANRWKNTSWRSRKGITRMWRKLFRAEIYKIIGHRWATGCMIGIFPFGAIGITLLMLLVVALSSQARAGIGEDHPQW